MPWDQLSAEQRRTVALQLDYQHGPATEPDRQFWWDHFQRQDELKPQIRQWEAAAAPTAGDLALRETRLKELRQELARMKVLQRQARGDYDPERKSLSGAMVDLVPLTATLGNLMAICSACETMMYRRVSLAKLEQLRENLDITMPQALEHIGASGCLQEAPGRAAQPDPWRQAQQGHAAGQVCEAGKASSQAAVDPSPRVLWAVDTVAVDEALGCNGPRNSKDADGPRVSDGAGASTLFFTFFVPRNDNATRRWRKSLSLLDFLGGRCKFRTCDPCRVKAVLYR